MNINRQNYESYFLLYIDNEMSVAEKRAVDEFVQSNPDLQEELVMLQQSILQPDHIVFNDKGRLLQNETAVINIREKLLLHLDNELVPLEKIELDALITTNIGIEKEWNLLQQTKLLPDSTIVFEDKESLYRKEAGRLVALPWRRVLAAAVLIGFGLWGGLVYFNNDNKAGESSIAGYNPLKPKGEITKPATNQATATVVSTDEKEKELTATPVTTTPAIAENKQQSPGKDSKAILPNRVIPTIVAVEKSNNLPKPSIENINKIESNKTIIAYVTPEQEGNSIVNTGNNNSMQESTVKQDAANVYAASASFTENSEETNNHVLFMDEEKIKKTKLGGMFRKVKRVIERNTNIKPGGNNIKVANLEFAIQ